MKNFPILIAVLSFASAAPVSQVLPAISSSGLIPRAPVLFGEQVHSNIANVYEPLKHSDNEDSPMEDLMEHPANGDSTMEGLLMEHPANGDSTMEGLLVEHPANGDSPMEDSPMKDRPMEELSGLFDGTNHHVESPGVPPLSSTVFQDQVRKAKDILNLHAVQMKKVEEYIISSDGIKDTMQYSEEGELPINLKKAVIALEETMAEFETAVLQVKGSASKVQWEELQNIGAIISKELKTKFAKLEGQAAGLEEEAVEAGKGSRAAAKLLGMRMLARLYWEWDARL